MDAATLAWGEVYKAASLAAFFLAAALDTEQNITGTPSKMLLLDERFG